MPNKNLYALSIPQDSQTLTRSQIKRNTATHGILGQDTAAVQSISLEPGQQLLRGQFRGKYSSIMAEEIEQLFNAGGIESVPFFTVGSQSKEDGYYALKNVDVEPLDPRGDGVHKFDGVLTKEGTRESKRRVVATTERQAENDFGNNQTAYVGVPSTAKDVRWLDSESGQTEAVTVVETRTAEHGDVDVVDAKASSYTDPTLVYDLAYDQEGKVDPVVWDDHGRAKLDSDGINSWQWVFSTAHEYSGNPVCDNGLVRLTFDVAANTLSVEEWDSSTSTWSAVALGTSSWEFAGLDVTEIGLASIDAQVRFQDPSQSPTAEYHLNMSLKRGWEWPLWTVPENETPPTPAGLQDLLAPVASGSDYDPQEQQTLIAREEVRK